jgi:hypothetical protein
MWGLALILLLQKNLYFITFKYKGSKYKFIEFTQDRKSYFEKMIEKIAFIEIQTGNKVKRIKLDNAPEFILKKVKNYIKTKGIRLKTITYYTLKQNSIAEQGMRIIGEANRALLEDSQLLYKF